MKNLKPLGNLTPHLGYLAVRLKFRITHLLQVISAFVHLLTMYKPFRDYEILNDQIFEFKSLR
jgi:hypothetical protein